MLQPRKRYIIYITMMLVYCSVPYFRAWDFVLLDEESFLILSKRYLVTNQQFS